MEFLGKLSALCTGGASFGNRFSFTAFSSPSRASSANSKGKTMVGQSSTTSSTTSSSTTSSTTFSTTSSSSKFTAELIETTETPLPAPPSPLLLLEKSGSLDHFEEMTVETQRKIDTLLSPPFAPYFWICPESQSLVSTPTPHESEGFVPQATDNVSMNDNFTLGAWFNSTTSGPVTTSSSLCYTHTSTSSSSGHTGQWGGGGGSSFDRECEQDARSSLLPSAANGAAPWALSSSSDSDSPSWLKE